MGKQHKVFEFADEDGDVLLVTAATDGTGLLFGVGERGGDRREKVMRLPHDNVRALVRALDPDTYLEIARLRAAAAEVGVRPRRHTEVCRPHYQGRAERALRVDCAPNGTKDSHVGIQICGRPADFDCVCNTCTISMGLRFPGWPAVLWSACTLELRSVHEPHRQDPCRTPNAVEADLMRTVAQDTAKLEALDDALTAELARYTPPGTCSHNDARASLLAIQRILRRPPHGERPEPIPPASPDSSPAPAYVPRKGDKVEYTRRARVTHVESPREVWVAKAGGGLGEKVRSANLRPVRPTSDEPGVACHEDPHGSFHVSKCAYWNDGKCDGGGGEPVTVDDDGLCQGCDDVGATCIVCDEEWCPACWDGPAHEESCPRGERDAKLAPAAAAPQGAGPPWHADCEIIPDYRSPFGPPDQRPIVIVRHNPSRSCLRYSKGPRQGHFWDVYGEDYQSVDLARLALSQAPIPPGVRGFDPEARLAAPTAPQGAEQVAAERAAGYEAGWADGRRAGLCEATQGALTTGAPQGGPGGLPDGWAKVDGAACPTLERRDFLAPSFVERVELVEGHVRSRWWDTNEAGIREFDPPIEPVAWLLAFAAASPHGERPESRSAAAHSCGVVGCAEPVVWTKQTGSFLHCRCAKHLREDYPSEAHAMGLGEVGGHG